MPRYSIITPTILRPQLVRTCESVNAQTCTDWEHIVMADRYGPVPDAILHPQRRIIHCDFHHCDSGNTCRYNAWVLATGEYVMYLDDDNYLADERVFETFNQVTADVATFPIVKTQWGGLHFHCPPQSGKHGEDCSDGGAFLVKRGFARWLLSPSPMIDRNWIESLIKDHPNVQALLTRPLMIYTNGPAGPQ